MADGGGGGALETEIVLRLTQFERQLARAEARAIATANKAEKVLTKINGKPFDDMAQRYVAATTAMQQRVNTFVGVKQGFDGAAESARAFEAALAQQDGIDRLRASLDPLYANSRRYEQAVRQVEAAVESGAITQMQANRVLALASTAYLGAAQAAPRLAGAVGAVGGRFANAAPQIQNASYQIGDFAVQVANGTNAGVALGQQLPQLLGGFGVLGAVVGAAVAVGVPLVSWLLSTEDAADDTGKQIGALTSAIADYQRYAQTAAMSTADLAEKYGAFGEKVRQTAQYLAEAAVVRARDALDTDLSPFLAEVSGAVEAYDRLAAARTRYNEIAASGLYAADQLQVERENLDTLQKSAEEAAAQFGLNADEVDRLRGALDAMRGAETMGELRDRASEVVDMILGFEPAAGKLDPALSAIIDKVADVRDRAAEAAEELGNAPPILDQIAGAADSAAAAVGGIGRAAEGIIGSLRAAASAAWDLAMARVNAGKRLEEMQFEHSPGGQALTKYGNRGAAPTSEQAALEDRNTPDKPRRGRGGGGGGKGGRGKDDTFDVGQEEIDQLQRRIEMIGKTDAQVAELKARYDLLAEAKRRDLDLDKAQAGSTLTLRDQIDAQAAAIGRLTAEYEGASERAEFFSGMQDDLKSGFLDAIVEGENLSGVLSGLAKSLARAALEAAFFKSGPLAGGGVGGGLGGLLSGLFGRASGGGVRAGQAYRVNEAHGPSEVFVPSQSGAILNTSQAQKALGGTGRSGPVPVDVRVHGGDLQLTDSGAIVHRINITAAAAYQQAVAETRRNLGGWNQQLQTDGAL